MRVSFLAVFLVLTMAMTAAAGPYDEPGIAADSPTIIGWATGYLNYLPADNVDAQWQDPQKALGPATGNPNDVVALGERDVTSTEPPGEITFTFDAELRDRAGADLVIFENGFPAGDLLFGELGFVEVSTDGENWARFLCVSLTAEPVGAYGTLDPTDIHNLAGKHPNAYGQSFGTPFDLADLADDPAVQSGAVDLQNIRYVKIVDAPGGGNYFDDAVSFGYAANHPIYDAYPTTGSAGFDVEAVGVVDESATGGQADDDTSDDDAGSSWNDDDQSSASGTTAGCGV